ncbi:hypothetical protein KIPB_001669 [Kipferlia bialata]|uniref:Uncharacterized protein n=1 Tax=Kipferlia bialata TaxID=797122 RepID=A0A9K3CSC1_9EUKA|nr:hypothetical protein KIPB_001669 [Kipferlia bialata]|eukprot:g1669.t1
MYETTGVIPRATNDPFEAKVLKSIGVTVLAESDVRAYDRYFLARGVMLQTDLKGEIYNMYPLNPTDSQWEQVYDALDRGHELGFDQLTGRVCRLYARATVTLKLCDEEAWEAWYKYNAVAEGIDWEGNRVGNKGERLPLVSYIPWIPFLSKVTPRVFDSAESRPPQEKAET